MSVGAAPRDPARRRRWGDARARRPQPGPCAGARGRERSAQPPPASVPAPGLAQAGHAGPVPTPGALPPAPRPPRPPPPGQVCTVRAQRGAGVLGHTGDCTEGTRATKGALPGSPRLHAVIVARAELRGVACSTSRPIGCRGRSRPSNGGARVGVARQ